MPQTMLKETGEWPFSRSTPWSFRIRGPLASSFLGGKSARGERKSCKRLLRCFLQACKRAMMATEAASSIRIHLLYLQDDLIDLTNAWQAPIRMMISI